MTSRRALIGIPPRQERLCSVRESTKRECTKKCCTESFVLIRRIHSQVGPVRSACSPPSFFPNMRLARDQPSKRPHPRADDVVSGSTQEVSLCLSVQWRFRLAEHRHPCGRRRGWPLGAWFFWDSSGNATGAGLVGRNVLLSHVCGCWR